MPVSAEQREAIRSLLGDGLDTHEIAAQTGVSPGAAAAVKAYMTMGTYAGGPAARVAQTIRRKPRLPEQKLRHSGLNVTCNWLFGAASNSLKRD